MHILITDSGVGGLSVCAYAERFVRTHGYAEPVRLTFANAAPENDYGYNSMPSREVKLATFDRFLMNVTERYAPDFIYVACNTLSVLLPDTRYVHETRIPVKGIVETGAELLLHHLEADPRSVAMIFGTQTTIDAGTYPRLLQQRGIAPSRIVTQACPGLADTISEDRAGAKTASEIRAWVAKAIAKMPHAELPVVACLACTHYGYRKEVFADALADAGIVASVINPNERAVGDLFANPPANDATNREVAVEFVTRYAIPPATIEALSWFLSDISPKTIAAMTNFIHLRDLF
jgi:glutamate racemase